MRVIGVHAKEVRKRKYRKVHRKQQNLPESYLSEITILGARLFIQLSGALPTILLLAFFSLHNGNIAPRLQKQHLNDYIIFHCLVVPEFV